MTTFKPIAVILPDNKAVYFTDIIEAKRYASDNKGQLYRHNNWYEAVRKQCRVLIDMMIELRSKG